MHHLCEITILCIRAAVDVPQCFDRLTVSGSVRGVAQLGNEIFVSSDSSASIAVFCFHGRQNFERRRDVSFHQLTTPPRDIAVSAEFQQLFVADPGGQCVWELEKSWGDWTPEDQAVVSKVEPVSLSVNGGRLLVVEKRRLTVFDVSKKQLKPTTMLPKNWQAEHAVETSCKTFVVCGRAAEKPSVMEVNRRGAVVRVCDPQNLGLPCYLSAFSNDEADWLVVDSETQRIILLNCELEVVRVFLDEDHDDVSQPRRIVKSGYFLVGHATSSDDRLGAVSLYSPQMSTLQPLPESP